jgi:uncharacterized membrane protein
MKLSSAPACLDNQIEDIERTGGSIMKDQDSHRTEATFGPAEIGALAHLYRGEMYQSKVWRNRLDTTGNWAVVITGIALSVTFSNATASPIPILLVNWVVVVFLLFEARRYLYYDLFRVRVRVMEINFYGPILKGQGMRTDNHWNDLLAEDYQDLNPHLVDGGAGPTHPQDLRLDLRRAAGLLRRQDRRPPDTFDLARRVVGTRRHRPHPRRSRPRRWSPARPG